MSNYPEWATEKQKEGMSEFFKLIEEYGNFNVSYKQPEYVDEENQDSEFVAVVTWESHTNLSVKAKGIRHHEFRIAWNYEQYFDYQNNRVDAWQFVFAGGDATREISTEVLFMDLFFYLDGIAEIVIQE